MPPAEPVRCGSGEPHARVLKRFRKEARRELGAAGMPLLAEKTEQRRTQWVKER